MKRMTARFRLTPPARDAVKAPNKPAADTGIIGIWLGHVRTAARRTKEKIIYIHSIVNMKYSNVNTKLSTISK